MVILLLTSLQPSVGSNVFSDAEGSWHPIFLDHNNKFSADLPTRSFIGLTFAYTITKHHGFSFTINGNVIREGMPVTASDLSVLLIQPINANPGTAGVLTFDRSYSFGLASLFSPRKKYSFRFITVQYRPEAIKRLETELIMYERGNLAFEDCTSDLTKYSDWYWANVEKCRALHLVPIENISSTLGHEFKGLSQYDTAASIQRYVKENKSSVWFRFSDCVDEITLAVSDWVGDPTGELPIPSMISCTD